MFIINNDFIFEIYYKYTKLFNFDIFLKFVVKIRNIVK